MTIKNINVYYETKRPGREPYSSKTFGGSVTVELSETDDYNECFRKAWQIVRSQVLGKLISDNLATQEDKETLEEEVKTK